MAIVELLERYDLLDGAILHHGFVAHMRDYEIQARLLSGLMVRFQFLGVPEVRYTSCLKPGSFCMDDSLLREDAAREPRGFLWAVKRADVYPGWRYVERSERAKDWAIRHSLEMHEVQIETNVYLLTIVFHGLAVSEAQVASP